MPTISIPIDDVDESALTQLEYALTFASEDIVSARISDSTIHADVKTAEACESAKAKIQELVQRYSKTEFGLPQDVHFRQDRDLQSIDAWAGLLERRWVTEVGQGHVILRGLAAQVLSLIDAKVQREFANHFRAELELYPSTILSRTLDRCCLLYTSPSP